MKLPLFTLALSTLLLSNCASIVSKSSWPVSIKSKNPGVEFNIKKSDGTIISSGKTPQLVTLSSHGGYFKAASYTIETKKAGKVVGSTQITATLNNWYFGNILFGGIIGMVFVDPVTGAMYRFPESVEVLSGTMANNESSRTLHIASIDTLTAEQKKQLVRL